MYVNSINSMFTTLFQEPDNVLNQSTLFKRPTKEYSAEYLEDNSTRTPVNIAVDSTLSSQIKTNQSVTNNITSALSINSTVQAYLSNALSTLENIYSLAEAASDTTTTASARSDLNTTAQDALSQIDKIYQDAAFGKDYIMQGGSVSLAAGTDGQQTTVNYGNLNRTTLGIDNIDISTQTGADDAVSALEAAINNIKSQQSLTANDENMMQDRYNASTSGLKSQESLLNSDYSRKFTQTAFENSLAVISNKFDYAINIQAYTLTTSTVSTVFDSLSKISETIKTQQEKTINTQAQEEAQKQDTTKTTDSTTTADTPVANPNTVELPNTLPLILDETKKTESKITNFANSASSSLYELLQKTESTAPAAATSTPASSKASTTGK